MQHNPLYRLILAVSLLLSSVYAQAIPTMMLRMGNITQATYDYHMYDQNDCTHGTVPCQNPWDGNTFSDTASVGPATATSTATGSFGALSSQADVYVANKASSGASGNATGITNFFDSFTLTSDTLATGTAVDVRYSVQLDWSTNAQYAGMEYYNQLTNFGARLYDGGLDCCYITGSDFIDTSLMSGSSASSSIRSYTIGQTVDFSGLLHWNLRGQLFNNSLLDSQDLFLNLNARYLIEVLSPDAVYTTASGGRYSGEPPASVPEPGTLPLLVGALLLGGIFRRNNKDASTTVGMTAWT